MLEQYSHTFNSPQDLWDVSARPQSAVPRRTPERRKPNSNTASLREGLLPAQLATLATMEQFHWHLHFVRRPLFQAPIPVIFDRDGTRFVVIREDGSLDENPTLKLRN